jgi:cell shape-determining protein MreC
MHNNDVYEELQRLRTENQDLRQASERFGQLAERLNQQLRTERELRADTDRQQALLVSVGIRERLT